MPCRALFVGGLVAALMATRAGAQRLWPAADPGRSAGFEVAKRFFGSGSDIAFASFVVTAEGRIPLSDKLAITAAVPFARISESTPFNPYPTSTAFGNPWIGVEATAQPDLVVEAGIRPGIANRVLTSPSALELGTLADFDRFEAWLPDVTSLRAMAHVGRIPAQGTFVSGMFGGTLFLPKNGGGSVVYANYGARIGVRDARTLTSLSVTGRVGISHGGLLTGSLSHTVHQAAVMVEGTRGTFRPSASIGSFLNSGARDPVVTIGATLIF